MDNATLAQQLKAEFDHSQSTHDCLRHVEAPLAMGLSTLLVAPDQGWRVVAAQLLPIINSVLHSSRLTNNVKCCYAVLQNSKDNLEFYKGVVHWVFPTLISHYNSALAAKM